MQAIPVTDADLFEKSLRLLRIHARANRLRGRMVQIFLGLKFFQGSIPSMYSGSFIRSAVLESMLDDLYCKVSRPANAQVLSLFSENFLARTGVRPEGKTEPANNWRNNFNLQKGIGCYAAMEELASPTFVDESRSQCRHLTKDSSGTMRCGLAESEGTPYRDFNQGKWLQIEPKTRGYAVVDTQRIESFRSYLAPNGARLPWIPLVLALYHDAGCGLSTTDRATATTERFQHDFNLSSSEFAAYFESDPRHPANLPMVQAMGDGYTTPASTDGRHHEDQIENHDTAETEDETSPRFPRPIGTPVTPPSVNSGWEAEQYVLAALQADGWSVELVSRQQLGYDLCHRSLQTDPPVIIWN